jgi:hypothetical protein
MSGIKCKCGKYFSTGIYPFEYCYYLVSEPKLDDVDQNNINRDEFRKLFSSSDQIYRCEFCNRLILPNNSNISGWDFYKLEDD